MYQWVDPDTGTTQLSGKPPVWYRGETNGPRVFVFENGKLVDDTEQTVSTAEQERLRQQAFLKAEEDKDVAREKLLQAKRLKATVEQKRSREKVPEEELEEIPQAQPPSEAQPADKGPNAEDMRALIEQWEKLQSENARKQLEGPK